MDGLSQTLRDIQDYLAPKLDGWEQMIYHYVFRHTILEGMDTITVPARSVGLKIGKGRDGASELSRNSIPRKLRTLEQKGAIKILGKTTSGTRVQIVLPRDIPGLVRQPNEAAEADIETVDFFAAGENRLRIFERDARKCSYCLKSVANEESTLDHIISQSDGGNHSYKNLVTACFECNSRKHSRGAEEFLRENYRTKLISTGELEKCLAYIVAVGAGKIVPK